MHTGAAKRALTLALQARKTAAFPGGNARPSPALSLATVARPPDGATLRLSGGAHVEPGPERRSPRFEIFPAGPCVTSPAIFGGA